MKNLPESCTSRMKAGLVGTLWQVMFFIVTKNFISWCLLKTAVFFPSKHGTRDSNTCFPCECCLWFMAGWLICRYSYWINEKINDVYSLFYVPDQEYFGAWCCWSTRYVAQLQDGHKQVLHHPTATHARCILLPSFLIICLILFVPNYLSNSIQNDIPHFTPNKY